jgi:hypothetical protein
VADGTDWPSTASLKARVTVTVAVTVWKPVSSALEPQPKGASSEYHVPLDTKAKNARLLKAAARQHSEDCVCNV